MVYDHPGPLEPIRQGDIFRDIPRADISLFQMIEVQEDRLVKTTWEELLGTEADNTIVAAKVKRVSAIVITQDCDALRSPDIALCEITNFSDVIRVTKPSNVKGWVKLITRQSRMNLKWFYLPPDGEIGFADRMAANFQSVIQISREDLDELKATLRMGRLNSVALAHFRERVGEFFRRYPYDEWYPFNQQEFNEYKKAQGDSEDIKPYKWQE